MPARQVILAALLALLSCPSPAAFARRLPHRALTGTTDGVPTKQPRLRRPYARGVKTQDDDPPPPPAAAAPPSGSNHNSGDGGRPHVESDSGGRPNLGAILAGSILGVGALCTIIAFLLVRLCVRITGPPLPERPPTGAAGSAAPAPMDLPIIVGQRVTHPDGTTAGAIESSSSSSSSAASACSDCSEQRCCLEAATERGG